MAIKLCAEGLPGQVLQQVRMLLTLFELLHKHLELVVVEHVQLALHAPLLRQHPYLALPQVVLLLNDFLVVNVLQFEL